MAWSDEYVKKAKESTSSYAFVSMWYRSRKKEGWKGQLQELQRRLESFVDSRKALAVICIYLDYSSVCREAPPAFFRVQALRAPGVTTD